MTEKCTLQAAAHIQGRFFSIPVTDFQILSVLLISTENMQDFTNGDMFRKKSFQNFTFYFSNSIDYREG